jgi:hypothetical protein
VTWERVNQLLEVLINDEKATLTKLYKLCGVKNNVFSRTRVPSCQNPIVYPEINKNEEDLVEDGVGAQSRIGEITDTTESKIFTHFLKSKISFIVLETILNVPSELEYLEGLVKLAIKHKDEETQQVTLLHFLLYPP